MLHCYTRASQVA